MEIEQQRWAPLPKACILPEHTAFPFSTQTGRFRGDDLAWGGLPWEDFVEKTLKKFVFDLEYGPTWPPLAGCFIGTSCTEYASYPDGWTIAQGKSGGEIASEPSQAFAGKGARILDLDLEWRTDSDAVFAVRAVLVPNYGPAAKAWWWSGSTGATADELRSVLNGDAWPAGNFKKDNVKKKIVSLMRGKDDKFRFVLNEWKAGDAWWWGYGASVENIGQVLNGQSWADFPADKIQKRLVYAKRHKPGNWTFLMIPRNDVGWWWYPNFDAQAQAQAKVNGARVINVEYYGPTWKFSQDEAPFSAVLVQST